MTDNFDLGKSIAAIRRHKGLTQDDLAHEADIADSTLAKLERGAIKQPGVFTIAKIAQALEMSLDELLASKPSEPRRHHRQSNKPIKFVYSDVNGVLVRFFQRAFSDMSREHHIPADKIEDMFWHYNDAVNRGEMSKDDFDKALANHFGLRKSQVSWEKRYLSTVEPIDAMHECLREIGKQYQVGLLTNIFPGFVSKMILQGLLPDLNYDAIVDSPTAHAIKPEQRIYEIAEKRAGVPGDQIFFIDDSRTNLMSAERRGWRVLWFDDYRPEDSVKRIREALASKTHAQAIEQ